MIIGIVGSDNRAVEIGRLLSRGGHTVSFSDPTKAERALKAVEALGKGSTAESAYRQTAKSDALLMAVRWQDVEHAVNALGPYHNGIVIDATHAPPLPKGSGAQRLAHMLDNRHVVKAFVEEIKPGAEISVCSDDPNAMHLVEAIIADCGCKPRECGSLANAAEVERAALTDGRVFPE